MILKNIASFAYLFSYFIFKKIASFESGLAIHAGGRVWPLNWHYNPWHEYDPFTNRVKKHNRNMAL